MKKTWILALCILLAAALSLNSTIAYLQDSDSDVNVMTLGNVKIDQLEQQRGDNGKLEEFVSVDWYQGGVYRALSWCLQQG